MSNREKIKKALCEYIDSMDDNDLYEFILEQTIDSLAIYGCKECELEYGDSKCDEPEICKKRFILWITK